VTLRFPGGQQTLDRLRIQNLQGINCVPLARWFSRRSSRPSGRRRFGDAGPVQAVVSGIQWCISAMRNRIRFPHARASVMLPAR